MSDRSIRRAAEREARKAARHPANLQSAAERQEAPRNESVPVSEAQLAANRENSQKSTGPRTEEGKAKIRLNAVTTGLTGRTVCLPTDDAGLYQSLILSYEKLFQPVGPEESGLVQSLADVRWRLDRIPGLHMALLNKGRIELSIKFEQLANDRSDMLDIQVMLVYEKQFRNLELQEGRLARRREKETVELRRLQQERKANEADALERATSAYLLAQHRNQPFDYPGIGFEFSNRKFDAYLASLTPLRKQQLLEKAAATAEQPETMQAKPAPTGRPETMQAAA
jgi:hypothetical protein